MKQPKFSLNEYVVINDGADVEESIRGIKCQIRDYDKDNDSYQLYILVGEFKDQYLWASSQFLWSWSQYRLASTIDKNKYQEYIDQIVHANNIRDAIFKRMLGITPEHPQIDNFKYGKKVRVKRRAHTNPSWDNWLDEMNSVLGEYGKVLGTERRYNNATNEYEDVVKVEFSSKELFSDFSYSFHFLPAHLEIQD